MLKIASPDHFHRVALMMMTRIIAAVFGTLAVTSIQAMAETPATGPIPALAGKVVGLNVAGMIGCNGDSLGGVGHGISIGFGGGRPSHILCWSVSRNMAQSLRVQARQFMAAAWGCRIDSILAFTLTYAISDATSLSLLTTQRKGFEQCRMRQIRTVAAVAAWSR